MASLIQPNQLNNPTQLGIRGTNTIKDLLTEIVRGNVVLVLGHEGILQESESLCQGDVKAYMYKSFMEYMQAKDSKFQVSYKNFDDYYYHVHPDLTELKDEIVYSIDPDNGCWNNEGG